MTQHQHRWHPKTHSAQPVRQTVHAPAYMSDEEVAAKHRQSVSDFPELSLTPGEYVIQSVRRHPIGLLSIWLFIGLLVVLVMAALPLYASSLESLMVAFDVTLPSAAVLSVPALFIIGLFVLGGFVATYVYQANRFYLTNESVIQHVRFSLFNAKTQVVNLVNVEDASCDQKGILQHLFGYGTLRLSTQGDETVYRFHFVANPQNVVHAVNAAVEIAMRNLEGDLRMHQIRE